MSQADFRFFQTVPKSPGQVPGGYHIVLIGGGTLGSGRFSNLTNGFKIFGSRSCRVSYSVDWERERLIRADFRFFQMVPRCLGGVRVAYHIVLIGEKNIRMWAFQILSNGFEISGPRS